VKLFTTGATLMYTTTDTNIGIQTPREMFSFNKEEIPSIFSKEFFCATLENIMNNNIYMPGDSFWLMF
jgi:hypothetical protein